MEFSGQYLNYEEYRSLGGTLDLTPFNLLEFEARRQIDIQTYNRLKNLDYNEIPQEVKMCEYNIISRLNNYAKSMSEAVVKGGISSESTDGYSVSYAGASNIDELVKSKQLEINDIIRTYLLTVIVNNEHIMYCGVN